MKSMLLNIPPPYTEGTTHGVNKPNKMSSVQRNQFMYRSHECLFSTLHFRYSCMSVFPRENNEIILAAQAIRRHRFSNSFQHHTILVWWLTLVNIP